MLRDVSLSDLPMDTSVEITLHDKRGNIIPEPPKPKVRWIPAFRYYRLSQASQDLFEAYRNLFLGFESVLNEICPKANNERETDWYKRALIDVNEKVPLSSFAPSGHSNPVAYLVGTLYEHNRCKLFHAKGQQNILPHNSPNPISVADAYETLIGLWRQIASEYYNIPRGGGVVTYGGFKTLEAVQQLPANQIEYTHN